MAVPTSTTLSFTAIGNREDLSNTIWDISPMDRPFTANISRVAARGTYHEWQTDALDAAAANANIEGDDASNNDVSPSVRVGNRTQILDKVVQVSGTQRAVDSAGRADEFSYQLAKRGRELLRDLEFVCLNDQAGTAGGAGTARTLGAVGGWLATNRVIASTSSGAAGTVPGFSSGTIAAPTAQTDPGAFTESDLKTAIQNCWSQGGDPTVVMVGAHNKSVASGFAGIATQYKDNNGGGQATIIAAADVYVSDFGEHMIVPNRLQKASNAYVLDLEYFAIAELRAMETNPLAKTGDSDRTQLIEECTLEVRNEAASAQVRDLTTS